MKSRPQNRGLSYYRRSDDKQEASLGQQHGWARETADKMGVVFRGTLADVERMQQQKLSHHQDIYIDDAITGGRHAGRPYLDCADQDAHGFTSRGIR